MQLFFERMKRKNPATPKSTSNEDLLMVLGAMFIFDFFFFMVTPMAMVMVMLIVISNILGTLFYPNLSQRIS